MATSEDLPADALDKTLLAELLPRGPFLLIKAYAQRYPPLGTEVFGEIELKGGGAGHMDYAVRANSATALALSLDEQWLHVALTVQPPPKSSAPEAKRAAQAAPWQAALLTFEVAAPPPPEMKGETRRHTAKRGYWLPKPPRQGLEQIESLQLCEDGRALLLWKQGVVCVVAVYQRVGGPVDCERAFPVDGRSLQYDRCDAHPILPRCRSDVACLRCNPARAQVWLLPSARSRSNVRAIALLLQCGAHGAGVAHEALCRERVRPGQRAPGEGGGAACQAAAAIRGGRRCGGEQGGPGRFRR